MMNNKDYYIIRNKALATAIAFISGQNYEKIVDRYSNTEKYFYKFRDNENFKNTLNEIMSLKNKMQDR